MTRPEEIVITVVAGGWSASQLNLRRLPGHVIAVNDQAFHTNFDAVVSMDRKWTEGRWLQLCTWGKPAWIRMQALKLIPPPWPGNVVPFVCDHEPAARFAEYSVDPQLNGTNSGFCAFNLAFQYARMLIRTMLTATIYLVGFDMRDGPSGQRHSYKRYAWGTGKIGKAWIGQFDNAAMRCREQGITVFTAGDYSAVNVFRRVPYAHLAERYDELRSLSNAITTG